MNLSLKQKTFENIGYNFLARIITFSLQIPSSIILGRQLTSDDYGIVGFATIFINFLMNFSDLGIRRAVIQKVELSERGLYTGFTIKFILGLLIFSFAFFLTPIANIFLNNNAVEGVIKLLSLNFIMNSFVFLPEVILTKELNYRKLSMFQVVTGSVTSIISIILALNGFKYWSIVIANVCSTVISTIFINILMPFKIRFYFEKKVASEFLHFGSRLFLSGIIAFIIFNVDNFIIGTVKGSQTLGYYSIAFTWGSMACIILGSVVNNVLFPTFSKMQGDKERLKKVYLEIMEYISFIAILANMGMLIVSKEFLFIILGGSTDKWLPALTIFRILCIYGMSRALLEPIGSVILALGKTNLLLKSCLIVGALELCVIYPALRYFGIEGVAIAITIVYSLQYFIYFPSLRKEINLRFSDFLIALKPSILSALVISTCFIFFTYINNGCSLFLFFIKLSLIVTGYVVLHGLITRWKLLKEMKYVIGNWSGYKREIRV
ncbi:MAG: lipopolysaccharide biosynthesis protein [Candidatus Brocadia sp.]|nr:lipopolysaccharide biosynthesis protein [Candidatus Brocadia sp.]